MLIFVPAMFIATRAQFVPRSFPIINWLVLLVLLGAPRRVVQRRPAADATLALELLELARQGLAEGRQHGLVFHLPAPQVPGHEQQGNRQKAEQGGPGG